MNPETIANNPEDAKPLTITPVDLDTFRGTIPAGHDLVAYCPKHDVDGDTALVLYGFDEVGTIRPECGCRPSYGFA